MTSFSMLTKNPRHTTIVTTPEACAAKYPVGFLADLDLIQIKTAPDSWIQRQVNHQFGQ